MCITQAEGETLLNTGREGRNGRKNDGSGEFRSAARAASFESELLSEDTKISRNKIP